MQPGRKGRLPVRPAGELLERLTYIYCFFVDFWPEPPAISLLDVLCRRGGNPSNCRIFTSDKSRVPQMCSRIAGVGHFKESFCRAGEIVQFRIVCLLLTMASSMHFCACLMTSEARHLAKSNAS